ncbi:MAG: hypothetical protein K0Q65_2479 [Clostridia bacterium]|jgi:K+-sensing histidine kinase KdpD|nr:hypothetical protein [Clostridia bacterium]MDF2595047.1 hypothetical protein [Clostridia bacterium]
MKEKVLVCITIQENSRRLISEGFNTATTLDAPLHILHIRKGETIFDNPESSSLLEELFDYGSELGGEIHFLCSHNISQTIMDFIITHEISHLVIGESPIDSDLDNTAGISEEISCALDHVTTSVISKEDYKFQEV